MADSFFGFDTSHAGGLDDVIDCPIDDDDIIEEDEYDALNDETFGADASAGDWEQDHEKLAQITESTRPQSQGTTNNNNKNGIDVDIEDSLSHLVLDEKDGIVPRPGVWDSPSNLSLTSHQPPSLSVALKNVCTVEELERGLIRPPPGLIKVPTSLTNNQMPARNPPGQFMLEYPTLNDHINLRPSILNNLPPPRFPPGLGLPTGPHPPPGPHPVVLPSNVGLSNAAGLLPPNVRALGGNQAPNFMRYPIPPHLMMTHGNQRQPIHPNFVGNFPQGSRPNILPQFLRPDHPLMPPFPNNHINHPHHHHHHHLQQHQQQQQQQHTGNQRNKTRGSYQHNELATPTNHQPFFKSNQHWNQNRHNNQRYPHSHSMNGGSGGNGLNDNGDYDEYAGLMSTREKQWLTNIQLLQHNTNQPYFDDYYYTVFCDRVSKKSDNQDNQQQHNKDKKYQNKNGYNNRDSRDKSDQPQQVLTKVVYTPTQFENSLGKLQCGSVTAPRKIIDMDVVPNSDPQQIPPSQQKDMKKARQRLLEIERLYTIQLKLEDINNPLAQLAEQQALQQQQQQQQQSDQDPEPKPVKKTAPELINIMLTSLLQLLREDKLASILSIRKGKTLLLRFLPFLSVTEYAKQLGEFWFGFIRGLCIIGRRDSHLLVRFFPEFHRWLETINDFSIILRLARGFLDSSNQINKNNNSLTFAVNNKFGVSVIASLLEQAENLFPKDRSLASEWSSFIVTLADIIGNSSPSVSPCQPIAANTLNEHLHRIHGLTIERYAPIESLLTDENTSR